jgi:hypothetical protein
LHDISNRLLICACRGTMGDDMKRELGNKIDWLKSELEGVG